MTPPDRNAMVDELAGILGVERDCLPKVFLTGRVQILKRGVRFDIMQRYPLADPEAISNWLERYTNSKFYLIRFLQGSRHRHDLDGNDTDKILSGDRASAKQRLSKCK